jgi:hypothetical protein
MALGGVCAFAGDPVGPLPRAIATSALTTRNVRKTSIPVVRWAQIAPPTALSWRRPIQAVVVGCAGEFALCEPRRSFTDGASLRGDWDGSLAHRTES